MPLTPLATFCAASLVCLGIITKCFCDCCRGPPTETEGQLIPNPKPNPKPKPPIHLQTLSNLNPNQTVSNEAVTI